MQNTFRPADVTAFEHATWSRCAPGYEVGFADLTREAVDPVLDAAGVQSGIRMLDVGTGSGVVARAAHARGALVTGVDFAEEMLAEARRLAPTLQFRLASAESLPFEAATFDAVVGNAVLHHLAEPDKALAEAHRVLVPGGRVACTVWDAPEKLEAFGLFFAAVEQHAGTAQLPRGPLFGVAEEEALTPLFTAAGFTQVTVAPVAAAWRLTSIDALLGAFGTWAQLEAFPAGTRRAIEVSVRSAAGRYRTRKGFTIPNPMLMITASRPA